MAIEPSSPPRRPAHRPSRRSSVIDAAMTLFAEHPVDEVTVIDIANATGMTPAAVYYHFASKEQILLEGMQQFRDALLAEVRDHLPAKGDPDGVGELFDHLMTWTRRHRTAARVWFVGSIGLNLLVEAMRRDTRVELVELFRRAATHARGRVGRAEAGVIGVALVSLLETAAASMLVDESPTPPSKAATKRTTAEVRALADRIVGAPRAAG